MTWTLTILDSYTGQSYLFPVEVANSDELVACAEHVGQLFNPPGPLLVVRPRWWQTIH
jgi:hypothetical protein